MAFSSENACFTYIWKIKNLSSYNKPFHPLNSPSFVTRATEKSSWKIELNSATDDIELYQLFLKKEPFQSQERPVQSECELSILATDYDDINLRNHRIVDVDEVLEYPYIFAELVVPKAKLYGRRREALLPQDTLTIRCRIWQLGIQSDGRSDCTFFRNEIFLWKVERYSQVQEVITTTFESGSFHFRMGLYKQSLGNGKALVKIDQTKGHDDQVQDCVLSVLKANRLELIITNSIYSHLVTQRFYNISNNLIGQCLVDDTLSLKWTFTEIIQQRSCVQALVSSDIIVQGQTPIVLTWKNPLGYFETVRVPPNTLQESMLRLYKDRKFSDATLTTSDASFPVNKSVLCARSPVFCAMFESHTAESKTGVVHIPDLEPDTLERMLLFLYTDFLGHLHWEEAKKLYYAADKYDVPPLKEKCLSVLKSELLSASNVCDAIVLADAHQDQDLMKFVRDFVCDHDQVICSNEWRLLEENNPRLTSKLFREIFVKKRNY